MADKKEIRVTSKRVAALIAILCAVAALAYLLAGDYLLGLLTGADAENDVIFDVASSGGGDTYTLSVYKGTNYISRIDGDGRKLYERAASPAADVSKYYISGFFASSVGDIFLAVYEYDKDYSLFERLCLYVMDENAQNAGLLLEIPLESDPPHEQMYATRFSSFSEDNAGAVYFALMNVDDATIYSYESGRLAKGDFFSCRERCNTFIALGKTSAMLGLEDGVLRFYKNGEVSDKRLGDVIISQFMQGGNSIYFVDAMNNALCAVDAQKETSEVVFQADDVVINQTGYRFRDIFRMDVNGYGGAVMLTYDKKLYVNGSDSEPYLVDISVKENRALDLAVFALIVLACAAFAVTVWYIYYFHLSSNLSLVARQALAMVFIVALVMNLMISKLVQPGYRQIMEDAVEEKLITLTSMFAAGANPDEPDYGMDVHSVTRLLFSQPTKLEQVNFTLYELLDDGNMVVRASNQRYEDGFRVDAVSYRPDVMKGLNEAILNGNVSEVKNADRNASRIYFMTLPDNITWIAAVGVNSNQAEEQMSRIYRIVLIEVNGAALLLLILLSVTQLRVARGIKRLNDGVERLMLVKLDFVIEQHSGDEIAALARSFNTMIKRLKDEFERRDKLKNAYYRFVPQAFVKLLGNKPVEEVGKESHVERTMVVMAVKFSFEGDSPANDTGALFDNINEVTERASGAVTRNGGTAYDFKSDGFNAVFEDDPSLAVSTAVMMRQAVIALNAQRAQRGAPGVKLRAALGRGSVMLGIIGDETRMAPTAVSDALTLCDGMVSCAGELNAYILCTKQVIERAGEYANRYIGLLPVGGAKMPAYEIVEGDPYDLRDVKKAYAKEFERALTLFYKGDFAGAKLKFMDIVRRERRDGVALRYLYLASAYENEAPGEIYLSL